MKRWMAVCLAGVIWFPLRAETQEMATPAFLCESVTADFAPLGRVPPYQRADIEQYATTPVTLDVLFLYSANRAQLNPASRIDGLMREANDIFRNSGTGITLQLAGSEQLPSSLEALVRYIEDGTTSNVDTLSRMNYVLQIFSRGLASEVQEARSRTRADLVVVWTGMRRHVGGIRALGIALQPGPRFGFSTEKGFTIVAGTPEQIGLLAHEIGHNLGLAHEPSARGWDPYLPHGQGYAAGGTVMVTNATASREVFSQDGFYRGRRVGDPNHRAAEAASVGARFVANYGKPVTPEPKPPSPDSLCRGGTCLLHNERFRVRVRYAFPGMSAATASGFVSGASAALHLFGGDGPELLTRVVDECATSGYWAFYAGAATNAHYSVAVSDSSTGELKWFRGPYGASLHDSAAFACDN